MDKYYLTTPIYYVNARPHVGHVYTTVAADVLARWERFLGKEVFFLTGADEHGSKVAAAADQAGLSPGELVDQTVGRYLDLWKLLEIKFDRFIRTTETEHQKTIQSIFSALQRNGDIYPGVYEGHYCVPCERYLVPAEGIDCADCGRPTEKLSEETYFFRLSRYQERIKEHFLKNPEFIQPERIRDEVTNMLSDPLPDLSLTRRCRWGVPLPKGVAGSGLTIYVWFDALLNYLSGVNYNPLSPAGADQSKSFKRFWPPDVQLVGKDIIRFHHIIWPAILMALNLPLPKKVFAHGWWLSGNEKMSKSKGNVVEPFDFCRRYGSEALRYFLLAEVPFGMDGNFTEEAFRKRYNSDLANDLGNLVHRFNHLMRTNFGGKVPPPGDGGILARKTAELFPALAPKMESLDFFGFLETLREVISAGNHYLDEESPWRKGPNSGSVLYNLTETSRILSIYLEPVLPRTAVLIRQQLGLTDLPAGKEALTWGLTKPGAIVTEAPPLFPRIK
ncbi:MAG: methionine--tRNA ligase [Candidatus Omnitrophota bacterium]